MPAVLELEDINEVADEVARKSWESVYDEPFTLVLKANALKLSGDDYFQFCRDNPSWRIEMTAQGELIIMPPTGGETSERNTELIYQLRHWTKKDGTGRCFESNAEFALPDGSNLSPDASWINKIRYDALLHAARKKFPPLCPDFVIELRSESDRLPPLQKKMEQFIANGAQLGLLIDPRKRRVYVYRPHSEAVMLENPRQVSCEPELPGFSLDLDEVW